MLAAHCIAAEAAAQRADASDSGLQPLARYGQNGWEMVLGRKNWLFAGSHDGGERAAAMYTLLETAKLNGIDPEAYLREVLQRIAEHPVSRIAELLPWNVVPPERERLAA